MVQQAKTKDMTKQQILEELKIVALDRLEGMLSFWLSLPYQDARDEWFILYMINEKQRRMELWN